MLTRAPDSHHPTRAAGNESAPQAFNYCKLKYKDPVYTVPDSLVTKGVNLFQKVWGGTDSKLGRSGGILPEIFFLNFSTLKLHSQRFGST
jgi:hypothetical protein